MNDCIPNLHAPPFDSGLNAPPKLEANLKPTSGREIVMGPGGSTSVHRAIETCQPLLGLHAHTHEAKGFMKIGNMRCVNSGSEYSEGILRGARIELDGSSAKNVLPKRG